MRNLHRVMLFLFLVPSVLWGFQELFTEGPERLIEGLRNLGYPLFVMKIMGTAQLLGAIAIIFIPIPGLKEWAYAGFTFLYAGAFASHLIAGDGLAILPLVFLCLVLGSYWTHRQVT